MGEAIEKAGLRVAPELAAFIDERALPGTGLESDRFWKGVAEVFARFAPRNAALLDRKSVV